MGFDFDALAEATSGAVGGLLSTTILYPLDTCKTKYQAEVRSGQSRRYRSLLDVLWEALESGKVLSLYQGVSTKNLQSVISQFIYFYSYKSFKTSVLQRTKAKQMGTGTNLLVAAAAGAVTAVLTQPLDTASARIQTSTFGKSKGLWATLTDGSTKDMFAGLSASLLLTSNPAIQYTVFEQLKQRMVTQKSGDVQGELSPVLSAFTAFLLGALSKTVATVITYPAIRCKVMIQAAELEDVKTSRKSDKQPPMRMRDAMKMIWHQEGALGFYKGLDAQILKTVLGAALMLMIKEKTSESTWAVMLALQQWSLRKPRALPAVSEVPGLVSSGTQALGSLVKIP